VANVVRRGIERVHLAQAQTRARRACRPGCRSYALAPGSNRREREEALEPAELAGTGGRSRRYDLRCSNEEVERWTRSAQAEGVSTSEFPRLAADERAASSSTSSRAGPVPARSYVAGSTALLPKVPHADQEAELKALEFRSPRVL